MKTKKEILADLCSLYREASKRLNKDKSNKIKGHLSIDSSRKSPQFYHCFLDPETGKYKKTYISKKDKKLISLLAQKSYNKDLKKLVLNRLKHLEAALKGFSDCEIENAYSKLSPERQELVNPVFATWDQYVAKWLNIPYPAPALAVNDSGILTNNGETVRSKTEKILAEMFFDQGIAYKYEFPLILGNKVIYPDFTFISPYNREEIYWEHHGMMGDPNYAESTVNKIHLYGQHNIYQGKNLILTFESNKYQFDFELAQKFINHYLKITK